MTRIRQLLLGLASGSAFYSGVVPALGLGEITLHSALNQPLEAEIELLQVADLSASDLSIRLASADVFARSGVDRLVFLNDLRFTPLLRGGNSVIRVVSNQPVREPYLNFIVEVARPNGQLLREYTVLLDPPGSSAYRAVAAAPQAQPARPTATASAPRPSAELGRRYRVVSGDSLWKIVARLRVAGSQASQQALMRDIQTLNPQAFSAGDPDRLRAGADLLLPDSAAGAPLEAAPSPAAGAQAAAPTELPGDPQVERVAQAQRRLEQELASQAEENARLRQGLVELQAQLQQLQSQMADKDRRLVELQAQLAAPEAPLQVSAPAQVEQPPVPPQIAQPAPDEAPAERGRSWLVAGSAALLLAAVFGLLWRRRRRAVPQSQEQEQPQAQAQARAEPAVPEASVPPRVEPAAVASRVAHLAPVAPVAPVSSASPADALEGANIYIAYGRLVEAAAILRKALQAQPQRGDIRFRLLEVLAQQGQAQAFAQEEAVLRAAGFSAARLDQLKARHPDLRAAAMDEPLQDLELDLDQAPPLAPVEALVDDDFQLNLDDLSLDADWDLVSPFAPGARNSTVKATGQAPAYPDELPATFGAGDARDVRSPFAESMLVEEAAADSWLQEELHEAFEPPVHAADDVLPDDLEQLAGSRDNLARLNLALAYIEQGNLESACDILNRVINEGDDRQKQEARELLARIA